MSNLIKIKRGTGTSLLESGELGFNTDTKTLYVGDDNINLAIGGEGSFVKKSGDTMTGTLYAPYICIDKTDWPSLEFRDSDGNPRASITITETNRVELIQQEKGATGKECYMLPSIETGLTANKWYNILTTKNPVTIAQGGTGATTAEQARKNLEVALYTEYSGKLLMGSGDSSAWITWNASDGTINQMDLCKTETLFSKPISISSGGTGATTADSACENIGAVKKSGDVMTGSLSTTRLGIRASNDYPTVGLKRNSDIEEHAFMQTGTNGAFGFYSYNADMDGKSTRYREGFSLPGANSGLTANKTYNILTSKNPVTVAQGGTGATTAAGACDNIGAVKKSGDTITGSLAARELAVNKAKDGYTLILFRNDGADAGFLQQSPADNTLMFKAISPDGKSIENFLLPTPNTGNGEQYYNILTSKTPVTVAQGGTGGTNPNDACYNLGAFRNTTTSDAYYMNGGSSTASAWVSYLKNGSALNQMDLWSSYTSFKQPVNIASGGTGATSAAGARTNLGITCANLGALPLSGGRMTGTITLHTTGLKTSSTSGFSTNQHGNFVHQTNTESHNWSICNSANTAKFQVWYETGAVTAQGKVTAPCFGGNGIRYSSSQPTSNLQTGQIWLKPV